MFLRAFSCILLLLIATITYAENGMQEASHGVDFRTTSKNILFAAIGGGASHNLWVLRILDQLHNRGHKVFFSTTDTELRFGDGFPHIKTSSMGPNHYKKFPPLTHRLKMPVTFDGPKMYKENTLREYKQNYNALQDIIKTESIDVVLCDHVSFACQEVAKDSKLPLIITMVINDADDADPPYMNKNPIVRMSESNTEHMPYARRFYDAFIWRAQALWHLGFSPWPIPLAINNKRWEDALKLVNNLYGVEDPRPMGPLVELVGPIYSEDVNAGTLDPDLEQYLDARQSVVYVAFGQFMMATSAETSTRVLHMLLENYEAGELDGFVWSAIRGTPLPEHITTSSGTHYYLNSTEFQNIGRIVPWVSQKAILRHPSIITFVTHGGAGSLYEAAYFGKRMLFTPFCGDQIYHALNFERKNAGLWFILEEADTNTMTTALNQVLKDENGTMQQEARRLQAIFQIHSQHALARATDLVEEVAFTADSDGKLPHRRDIARNLSFLKRNNYDLYLGLLALITAIVTLSYRVVVLVKEHLRIKKKVD